MKERGYLIVALNANRSEMVGYPISFRQTLPTIGIPLRESDADAVLHLQA